MRLGVVQQVLSELENEDLDPLTDSALAEDMVDLMGTARSYEANVAAISAVKDMILRSIDLLR